MKNNRKWKTTAFILTCGLTVALEGGAAAQTSAGSGLNAGIFATMDSYYNTDIRKVQDFLFNEVKCKSEL